MKTSLRAASLLLAGACVVHCAAAQEAPHPFYLVGSVGQSRYSISKGDLDATLFEVFAEEGLPVVPNGSTLDKTDTSWSPTVGYRFSPSFALEASYLDLGKAQYRADGGVDFGAGFVATKIRAKIESHGPILAALGILPFNDRWEGYVRAGVFFADTRIKVTISSFGAGTSQEVSGSSQDFFAGLGLVYNATSNCSLRLDWQRLKNVGDKDKTGEGDIDNLTFGFVLKL